MEERKILPAPKEALVKGIEDLPTWTNPKVHIRIAIKITRHRHLSRQ